MLISLRLAVIRTGNETGSAVKSTVCSSGDAGQVMVASTVAKLATIIDGEETAPSAWDSKPFCRCVKVMARAVLFPSGIRFCLAVQRALAYLDLQWSIIGIQSPRPHGPMRRRQTWMKSAKRIWQPYLNKTARPILPAGLFTWRYAGAGLAARLRARGEQVAFLGLLDTGRQKRKTGRKKKPMVWIRKCGGD